MEEKGLRVLGGWGMEEKGVRVIGGWGMWRLGELWKNRKRRIFIRYDHFT